jgi:hypothetical protein
MSNANEKIIKQKEYLAAKALQVAEDSLELLQGQLEECTTRDLVTVFNSAVKAHREIVSDIVRLTETESSQEQALAKEYDGPVERLLKSLQNNNPS